MPLGETRASRVATSLCLRPTFLRQVTMLLDSRRSLQNNLKSLATISCGIIMQKNGVSAVPRKDSLLRYSAVSMLEGTGMRGTAAGWGTPKVQF